MGDEGRFMVNVAAFLNKTHRKSMGDWCLQIAIAEKLSAIKMLQRVVIVASLSRLSSFTKRVVADGQGLFGRFGGWFADNVDEFDKGSRW